MKPSPLYPAILLCLLCTFTLNAQVPTWKWADQVVDNSSYSDVEGWAVAADADGNVYVTGALDGDTIDIGGSIFYNPAGFAIYVIKYDSAGTMLWARVDGGSGLSTPGGIAADADGNVIITGAFSGDSAVFAGTVLYNAGAPSQDLLIIKYDTNGNLLWAISAGGTDNEWAEAVSVDPGGNLFVTGSFDGASLTLGGTTLINSGSSSEDIYLAKLDPSGNFLWAKSAGGSNYEWATSVSADPFGNAVICGPYFSDTCSFGAVDLVSPYGDNYDQLFVAQYDSAGNVTWAHQVVLTAQAYDSYFYDVATDAFGNVFAAGSAISDTVFVDTLELVASPLSVRDMLLVKYGVNGNLLWARREFGSGNIHAFDVATNASGEAYVTGFFDCDSIVFGTDTTLGINTWYYSDMFLVKYLAGGTVEWATDVGGTYIPGSWGYRQMGVASDPQDHVYVSGTFTNDSLLFGNNFPVLNNCWPNVYIARMDDADPCSAAFTLVADTALLHHYWLLNQATGAAPLDYYWSWGDGTFDSTAYPSHIYASAGYYTICLTITDAQNCSHTECHTNNLQRSPYGAQSATMVEVNVVPSIPSGLDQATLPEFSITPNPTNGIITVKSSAGFDRVELMDMVGKTKLALILPGNSTVTSVDMTGFPQGIYIVKVSNGHSVSERKILLVNQQ